ncbi:MAG: hypothetical protein FJY95_06970 [Candidatus Handelsmanbacteria bacterium]|nr:hypothetical protein [Candidatus Handelsmanbacteria bacterium]
MALERAQIPYSAAYNIGAEVTPPQNKILYFTGLIDEGHLYNRAFSGTEWQVS